MSVVLASASGDPQAALAGHEGYALATITAGLAREVGQRVVRNPLPDEPSHALVVGRKTDAVRRRLARDARWVVPPPEA